MKIKLTETQIRQLMPFFDRVHASADLGRPGMLVAQIRWSYAEEKYWMEPGFLEHEYAALITQKGQRIPPMLAPTERVDRTAPEPAQSDLERPADKL